MFPHKLIDLTHTLHSTIPSWSGTSPCTLTSVLTHDQCTTTTTFHVQTMSLENGAGTHMDAPAHCIPDDKTISDYTPQELYLECFTFDFSNDMLAADHILSVDDLRRHKDILHAITPSSCVLLHTGWSIHWSNSTAYRNNLIFPTLSLEAANMLRKKSIAAIGIDTLSVDRPEAFNANKSVHTLLLKNNIFIIENVANANQMPPCNAFIFVAPLNIDHGTEAPVRLTGICMK